MASTVNGVRFSDQLAALLDHAIAHGFRVEADTRGKAKANAVVAYPPNKDLPPISISERNARFNRPHYENVRRDLYRAGLPPLPADAGGVGIIEADTLADARAKAPDGANVLGLSIEGLDDDDDFDEVLTHPDRGPAFVAALMNTLGGRVADPAVGRLAADVVYAVLTWGKENTGDALDARIADASTRISAQLTAQFERQIDDAVAMAADAEAKLAAETKRVDRAVAAERKARDDCAAALRRAEAAEAKAAELEAAIAPLRSLLGKG